MKVIILCGGLGTRIRDVADDLPKPMIAVGQNPILWHIMNTYAGFGHTEFILCLGYKASTIKQFFYNYALNSRDATVKLGSKPEISYHDSDNSKLDGWSVTLADTGLYTMTGGRLGRIRKYVGDDEYFMVTYGDGLSNIDIDSLIDFHKSHGRIATVTGVRPPGRFGELEVGDEGTVIGFNEKPQATGGVISGGFFVFSARVFDYLSDAEELVLEQEPMRALVRDGELKVYDHNGFWHPMDTYRDFKLLNDLWSSGEAPWLKRA